MKTRRHRFAFQSIVKLVNSAHLAIFLTTVISSAFNLEISEHFVYATPQLEREDLYLKSGELWYNNYYLYVFYLIIFSYYYTHL